MRLPRALVVSVLLGTLAAAPLRAEPAPPNGLVYVLNSGEANILVLDAATREEVRRIPVLREVHHLTLTPDGKRLMVGDSGANEMLFIDPKTGEMSSREALSNPYHLGFSPDGKTLVITSLRRDQVDIYAWDGDKLSLSARLRLPDMPSHIAFSPDSKIAYVTLQGTNDITAIDLGTNKPVWNLKVGPQPAGIIWHNDRLLVGIMGSDHVAVVNPQTQQVERRVKVGRGAHALFPGPARGAQPGLLYVTSRVDSRITVLDPASLDIVRVLDVPGGPDCVSFDPTGRMWVTQRWLGRIALVDPETGVVASQHVGRSPHGILFEPTGGVTPVAMGPTVPVAAMPLAPAPTGATGQAEAMPASNSDVTEDERPPTPPPAGRRLFTPRSQR